MIKVSACLITLDEENNLPRALHSLVGIADEIVVADCGSTDRTCAIAGEFGARILERAWSSYSDQKNFAAEAASHDWILSLDADEELSPELRKALLEWKQSMPQFEVYEFSRRAHYLGAWIRHSGWYPDRQRRLYRRDAARFFGIIHESLRFTRKPGRLPGDILHYTISSFAEHRDKVENYSTLAARQMLESGRKRWRTGAWLAAPWAGIRCYLLRCGFLDGYRGILIARMAARTVRLKYRKLGRLLAGQFGPGSD
ncbi:MAG TPA: glycosyltransferase family 2 protein [Acidobacteriota bacterium]|nr:glycosyltransferase family 2 protein [Acidobacteriota bacterium]